MRATSVFILIVDNPLSKGRGCHADEEDLSDYVPEDDKNDEMDESFDDDEDDDREAFGAGS